MAWLVKRAQMGRRKRNAWLGSSWVLAVVLVLMSGRPLAAAPRLQSIDQIMITDIRNNSFVVSWTTAVATDGHVDWGTTTALGNTTSDVVNNSTTHYVLLESLAATTTYYFQIRSGGTTDNNGGAYYSVVTGPVLGIPDPGKAVWGYVYAPDGVTPVANAIVYLAVQDRGGGGSGGSSQFVSARTDSNGIWYYGLGSLRVADATAYYVVSDGVDNLYLAGRGGSQGNVTLNTLVPGTYPTQIDLRLLGSPTAVMVEGFVATPEHEAVLIAWETATEVEHLGFNLYRSEAAGGPYVRLNSELIPAQQPGQVGGASYIWRDTSVPLNVTLYYRLEDVDIRGVSTWHEAEEVLVLADPSAGTLARFAVQQIEVPVVWLMLALGGVGGGILLRRRGRQG